MRALCGAIITTGALIGLGLAAIGIGTRYTMERSAPPADPTSFVIHFRQLDTPMAFILVLLALAVVVGLGITFVGLAYHHARREREFAWEKDRAAAQHRTTV